MVRFHWHVEDGFGAFIPPCSMVPMKDTKVHTAVVEIELPGQQLNVEALLTVPPGYLSDSEIKDVGIILAHGNDADDWRSKLLSEVSLELGKAGHVVMRYHCPQKEQRRQRVFEKALDACATSPFARMCNRWVLAGIGSGARVAAMVGARCRGVMAGFVLMSYPLMEPMPTSKGASLETSLLPLTRLNAPLLFIQPGQDPLCNAAMIRDNLDRMPAPDIRMIELPNADGELKTPQPDGSLKGPTAHTIRRTVAAISDFVAAISSNQLDECRVQQLKGQPLSTTDTFGGAAEEEKLEAAAKAEEAKAAAAAAAAAVAAAPAPAAPRLPAHTHHSAHAGAHAGAPAGAGAGLSASQHPRATLTPRDRQGPHASAVLGQAQHANNLAAAAAAAAAAAGFPGLTGGLHGLNAALRPQTALPSMGGLGNLGLLPAIQGLLQGGAGAAGLAAALGLAGGGATGAPQMGALAGLNPGALNPTSLHLAAQQQVVAAALSAAGAGAKRPAEQAPDAAEREKQARLS